MSFHSPRTVAGFFVELSFVKVASVPSVASDSEVMRCALVALIHSVAKVAKSGFTSFSGFGFIGNADREVVDGGRANLRAVAVSLMFR